MTVISLASAKASPGVTTTTLALAAAWPQGRPLTIIEADPDGGDLAARLGRQMEPGLPSLSTATRRTEIGSSQLATHAQVLSEGVRVLLGNPAADQATRELQLSADRLAAALPSLPGDVLIDVGRLRQTSPAMPLVRGSGTTLIVCRPRLDELQHVRRAVEAFDRRIDVLLIGESPYGADEVEAAVGAEVLGVLPDDPRAAEALRGATSRRSHLTRSRLVRDARSLAQRLTTELAVTPAARALRDDEANAFTALGGAPAPAAPSGNGRLA